VKLHLARFVALCPASLQTVPDLRWSDDKELLKSEAARLRTNIEVRTNSEAVSAYPTVWSFEAALERSDHQAENQARVHADVDRLFGPKFTRNMAWLDAIQATNHIDGAPKDAAQKASAEIAALFPESDAALNVERRNALAGHDLPANATPQQIAENQRWKWNALLPLVRKWPNVEWLAFQEANAVLEDHSATPEEVNGMMALLLNAARQDPNGFPTMPPAPIIISQRIIEHGGPYESVPELIAAGSIETDRLLAPNDLYGREGAALAKQRSTVHLFGDLPLIEADLRLGRISNASDALEQAETRLKTIRPPDGASSQEKTGFGNLAASYWFLRGEYAEKEGRKIDALVDYRNALSLYPPRRPNSDRRAEVLTSAERLWKELGGTTRDGPTGPHRVLSRDFMRVAAERKPGPSWRIPLPISSLRTPWAITGIPVIWRRRPPSSPCGPVGAVPASRNCPTWRSSINNSRAATILRFWPSMWTTTL
jgi:tetratricopeptide (TPR) repeat protein